MSISGIVGKFLQNRPVVFDMTAHGVPVKSARRTFEVLEGLRELDGAGVSELAEYLDMPTSSAHDYLRTLEQEEFLIKQNETYHIGSRFLELGEFYRSRQKVYRTAKPEIDALAGETGEHGNLMIEEHGRGVFLYTAKGEKAVELDTHIGKRIPLHTSAMGKSILASRPREVVEAIIQRRGLEKVTEKTIAVREELFDELDRIAEQGYAIDDEERIKGMRCVAAPIHSDTEGLMGAVSISAPKSRLRGKKLQTEYPDIIMDTANVIQLNLTYG